MARPSIVQTRPVLAAIARWWGLLLVYPLIFMLANGAGLGPPIVVGFLILVWSLVSAPSVCCAVNRETGPDGGPTYCRNNSTGLLLGCNQVRAHKWQKINSRLWWISFTRHRGWRALWASPSAWIATISGLLGIATPFISVNLWFWHKFH
jgi:hypothetical protein